MGALLAGSDVRYDVGDNTRCPAGSCLT